MKSKIMALSLVCVLLFSGAVWSKTHNEKQNLKTFHTETDFIGYNTKDELIRATDVIVIGKVIKINDPIRIDYKAFIDDSMSEEIKNDLKNQNPYDIYTVSDVEITKVIKGDIKIGDIIQIKQGGGTYKNEKHVWNEVKYFKKDEERLFFLVDFRKDFGEDMPFSEINPRQGSFEISKQGSRASKDNDLFKNEQEVEAFVKDRSESEVKPEVKPEAE